MVHALIIASLASVCDRAVAVEVPEPLATAITSITKLITTGGAPTKELNQEERFSKIGGGKTRVGGSGFL